MRSGTRTVQTQLFKKILSSEKLGGQIWYLAARLAFIYITEFLSKFKGPWPLQLQKISGFGVAT